MTVEMTKLQELKLLAFNCDVIFAVIIAPFGFLVLIKIYCF